MTPISTRQAITTRFLAPTNTRDARVRAEAQVGTLIVPWDSAKEAVENHRDAALALAAKWGWDVEGALLGALPKGGYVLVLATPRSGR